MWIAIKERSRLDFLLCLPNNHKGYAHNSFSNLNHIKQTIISILPQISSQPHQPTKYTLFTKEVLIIMGLRSALRKLLGKKTIDTSTRSVRKQRWPSWELYMAGTAPPPPEAQFKRKSHKNSRRSLYMAGTHHSLPHWTLASTGWMSSTKWIAQRSSANMVCMYTIVLAFMEVFIQSSNSLAFSWTS